MNPSVFAAGTETATLPFHSHASVLLVIGAVAVFYWWAFTRLGPRLVSTVPSGSTVPAGSPAPAPVVATARQKQWIVAGIVWTFVFSYWPLHDIAERYLFLAHMTQHTIFTLVAPACFLLGSPAWLWSWVLDRPALRRILQFFTKPLVALLVFNTLIAVTHWPEIVETSLHNELFHFLVHLVLFATATFMWVPVINRDPRLPRLGAPAKMVFLFAQSIVPTVPASFLTFSQTAMYQTYEDAPRMIHGLTAVGDQQIAAAIMKLGAGSLLWGVVVYLFANWWRDSKNGVADDHVSERGKKATDPKPRIAGMTITGGRVEETLTWEQVKAEFERLEADEANDGSVPNGPIVAGD